MVRQNCRESLGREKVRRDERRWRVSTMASTNSSLIKDSNGAMYHLYHVLMCSNITDGKFCEISDR